MSSTFTSPIRINKRNNPTNNGVIAPSNTGATICSQEQFFAPITTTIPAGVIPTFKIGQTTATPLVIPAGSNIGGIKVYQTSTLAAITGGNINISLAVVDPTTGVITTTLLGTYFPNFAGGSFGPNLIFAANLWQNVGPLDATIVIENNIITAITGALEATIQVLYTPRNADGSITAYGSNLTNN